MCECMCECMCVYVCVCVIFKMQVCFQTLVLCMSVFLRFTGSLYKATVIIYY